MSKNTDAAARIAEWQVHARAYAASVAKGNLSMLVSVNDLYTGIVVTKELAPPPNVGSYKRGHALCSVFTGSRLFAPAGETVLSINPASKCRKVKVWEYVPWAEDDDDDDVWTRPSSR